MAQVQTIQSQFPKRLKSWWPYLVVFVSNACIMILELVAGRIIAPQVGVSLYTWTSVIGVILAGMSLGNFLGGRLADRRASPRLLGTMFMLAGLTSMGILAVDKVGVVDGVEWPIVMEILILITALFFLPATILGTISPIVVKLAMQDLARVGRTVGKIYASGTVGSIVGTFATGFWLISQFGTHTVVWGVAVVLLAIGACFLLLNRRLLILPAVLVIAALAMGVNRLGWTENVCMFETNYFCIKVREEERDGAPVRVLILDRLVHSYSSLDDPTRLVYDYEKIYAEITRYLDQKHDEPLRAFFIGGGGYTFPRYIEALYPDSEIDVAEIDPGVTQVAYNYLGLDRDSRIVSYNEDARMFLERKLNLTPRPPLQSLREGEKDSQAPQSFREGEKYTMIVGDAFNDFSVPYHLTTKGFNERVHAWLEEDGVYIVNVIDGGYARFLRAYVHTLRQTFKHVTLVPRTELWRHASRDTFVVIASDTPLDLAAFEDDALLLQKRLSDAALDALLREGEVVMLTDRYAPVEQMLAPVFLEKTADEE
jgi:spermidine synthase